MSVADAQRYGKFTLPAGAKDLRAHMTAFQDYYLRVRFSMPPDALDPFLASTIVVKPLSSEKIPDELNRRSSDPQWWNPGKPTTFLAGSTPNDGTIFQYILIDKSDPENYVVYLIAHDM